MSNCSKKEAFLELFRKEKLKYILRGKRKKGEIFVILNMMRQVDYIPTFSSPQNKTLTIIT